MPDGVNAAVNAVKAAGGNAPLDLARRNSGVEELRKDDNPVLAPRYGGDYVVRRGFGAFPTHTVGKAPGAANFAPRAPRGSG